MTVNYHELQFKKLLLFIHVFMHVNSLMILYLFGIINDCSLTGNL